MAMLRTLFACGALCVGAASSQGHSVDRPSGRTSLLQIRGASTGRQPSYDFFDDVPIQVLQDMKSKGGHAVYTENSRVSGDALAVGGASSNNAHHAKPVIASLLAANAVKQKPDQDSPTPLKRMEGFDKKPQVAEDADDPRAIGFGVQSFSAGGGVVAAPAEATGKAGEASAWDMLSFAHAGARAAFRSALPKWHGLSAAQEPPARVVETDGGEVDHSAQFAPGAAAIISRRAG